MKEAVAFLFMFLMFCVVCLGLDWAFTGNDFFIYRFFGPKTEAVRRDIYKESQAYNDGTVQDLQNLQLEYVQNHDDGARSALSSVILQRAAVYPEDRMPPDLRDFIDGLRRDRGLAQ
jgi:hypothetical protein